MKKLLATVAVVCAVSAVHAETLVFNDPNAIQDWWYTDETKDESLVLFTKSNDPSQAPLYLFCRYQHYSFLFQPPVPPVKDEQSGQMVYKYKIHLVNHPVDHVPESRASVIDNRIERTKIMMNDAAWFMYGHPFKVSYKTPEGEWKSSYYIPPPRSAAQLFGSRCANQDPPSTRRTPPQIPN